MTLRTSIIDTGSNKSSSEMLDTLMPMQWIPVFYTVTDMLLTTLPSTRRLPFLSFSKARVGSRGQVRILRDNFDAQAGSDVQGQYLV